MREREALCSDPKRAYLHGGSTVPMILGAWHSADVGRLGGFFLWPGRTCFLKRHPGIGGELGVLIESAYERAPPCGDTPSLSSSLSRDHLSVVSCTQHQPFFSTFPRCPRLSLLFVHQNHLRNSNIVTDGFYVARTGLGPFGEGWEEKGEDVDWFLYNRLWGVGVFTLMENIGLEPTEDVSVASTFHCRRAHPFRF